MAVSMSKQEFSRLEVLLRRFGAWIGREAELVALCVSHYCGIRRWLDQEGAAVAERS